MAISNLNRIINPKSIALVGASDRVGSVGYILMKNFTEMGYEGKIYPINVRKPEILGHKTYKSVEDLPEAVDLAVIATPAKTVPDIVEQCGKSEVGGLIIISAGFKEIGAEGKALEERVLQNIRKYHLRTIGPNCLGVISPGIQLNATFTNMMPKAGNIAFISQSGALGSAILDWAIHQDIGFSNFVSVGSMIDVGFGDLIDYFGTDPQTRSILIYIEGITNARKFLSAARHFAKTKPIIVVKSGRFSESAKAAASHTGSLSGEDMIYDAAFKRAGLVRVDEIADLFNAAEVLGMQPLPKGPNLAIITNAGGPGVMATDSLIAQQGKLAELSSETMESLNKILPHFWSRGNPIDILGDAKADRYKGTLEVCLNDKNIDGILIIYTRQAIGEPTEIAKGIVETIKNNPSRKTILASFMGYGQVVEAVKTLTSNHIPIYSTPEQAIKTYVYMYQYKHNLESLYETPEELPADIALPKTPLRAMLRSVAAENREILTEEEAKTFLAHRNIPVVPTRVARTAEQAVSTASRIGYPVVLKILSPEITHKTDAGGVALDIGNKNELESAFQNIIKNAKEYDPKARILGVTVQPMIKKRGCEVIIGAKKDPIFGPVVLFGMGGIGVEIFKDVSMGFPPLNRALARRIMEDTKINELLKGYRNIPPANMVLLEEILVRFSQMLIDFPHLKEVDINPLFVNDTEALALDARIVIDKKRVLSRTEPHDELVITPYPSRYEDIAKLRDGRVVLLRPIKPEDEPLWLEMFETLSEESIGYRFFKRIQDTPHETRIRYCNIDYDREMAIIAELAEDGKRKIIGVIRLLMEPYTKNGQIAFIVADPWQGFGLGTAMLEHIMKISKEKGLETIYASILPENQKSVLLLEKRGFTVKHLLDNTIKATYNLRKM